MGKFTKFLYHNLALALLFCLMQAYPLSGYGNPPLIYLADTTAVEDTQKPEDNLAAHFDKTKGLRFKGDYFIYSDDINYLFGTGNITMAPDDGNIEITGDVLYLKIGGITGVLYGNVRVKYKAKSNKTKKNVIKEEKYDAIFFKGIPPRILLASYRDQIDLKGDMEMTPYFMHFKKMTPEELKDSSLYFEFKEFRINRNRRIKAKYVIAYMMGLPTFPLKSFTVRRGAWSERTLIAFRNVNYSEVDGMSAEFYFRLRENFIKGDHNIKIYERKLFGLEGAKRGILFSGESNLLTKKKNLLKISSLLNSGEESFSFRLEHRLNFKLFSYGFSQIISGQKDRSSFVEFTSDLTINRLKFIVPRFQFSYDWKKSYSYRFSTPLHLIKKLGLNFSWGRRIIKDTYRSDNMEFTTALNYNTSLFSLSSNYNFSKNLIEENIKKNFSVNMRLKPLLFLMNNVSINISSFCMISSLPFGTETRNRFSPGLNISFRSSGAILPLGFKLVPGFSFNHLWDNQEEDFTDFNYGISFQKEIGDFRGSLDYALASRYRSRNFWIEGNNRQNLNLSLEMNNQRSYSLLLRFYCNNDLELENISFTGQVNLPFDLNFSSFLLYYNQENKFQTLEVFIEKTFKKRIKIQGGYSLALKRFFIKFLTL